MKLWARDSQVPRAFAFADIAITAQMSQKFTAGSAKPPVHMRQTDGRLKIKRLILHDLLEESDCLVVEFQAVVRRREVVTRCGKCWVNRDGLLVVLDLCNDEDSTSVQIL